MAHNNSCFVCGRSYERLDHLRRHLQSHEDSRPFRCSQCSKGFNRADLLQRHNLSHARSPAANGTTVRAERASHACTACVRAKTKCDDTKPCKRCRSKALDCQYSRTQRFSQLLRSSPPVSLDKDEVHHTGGSSSNQYAECRKPSAVSRPSATYEENPRAGSDHDYEAVTVEDLDSLVVANSLATLGEGGVECPSFAHDGHDDILLQRLSQVPTALQDIYLQFADLDAPAMDIDMAAFGDVFDLDIAGYWQSQDTADTAQLITQVKCRSRLDPGTRSEVFRRSPWAHWHPSKLHHAFTGQDAIDARPADADAVASPLTARTLRYTIHDALDEGGRDRILQVVTSLKDPRFSIKSFPSLKLLNNLVTAFFAQENETIAPSIHQSTFSAQDTRPELLLGIIAAGAVAIPVHRIQMMGLVIHEVLRLSTTELFEQDNSTTRDLQAMQAFIRALEIGAWSGVKRKTEIACSFIQPIFTMLRQSGAFTQSHYSEPALKPDHNAEDHEHLWKDWTAKESLKRLALRAFVYDSQVSMGYFQLPAISFAQLSMPVPAPAGWWFAEDALHWRKSILTRANGAREPPLMREVLNDLTVLDKYSDQTDIQLCCFVAVHALANQVGELRQHMMLLTTTTGPKQHRMEAWCINRQRDLYEDLTAARMYCARRAPHHEIGLLLEYVMMSLYVSLEDIQRYAGQEGEGEALKLAPTLIDWSQTSAARTAIWHAGQVFRIARRFPPSTLRNVYALALYRSALTLWVYSLLRNGERASGVSTPVAAPFATADTAVSHSRNGTNGTNDTTGINGVNGINELSLAAPEVKLDQGEDEDVRVFLLLGLGTPGLCHSLCSNQEGESVEYPGSIQAQLNPSLRQFRSLTSPAFPMEVAKEILHNNALFACESPSLLVQNLVGLMGDLQSLFQNGNAEHVDPNIH